jgi:tetratricopeptide (TPR) repeat protein
MKNTIFIAALASLATILCQGLKGHAQNMRYQLIPGPDPILMHPIGNVAQPTESDRQGFLMDSLFEKASDAKRNGNYLAAFQIYTKIISLNSQEAQAYFNRGFIRQLNLNDRAGAMADFRTALGLFRQRGDNYMTRASIEHIQQLR